MCSGVGFLNEADTISKILNLNRQFETRHWSPSKLTHYNWYSDEDSACYPRQISVDMCQFTGIFQCLASKCGLCNFCRCTHREIYF